ncbi:MAG: hypothetical protein ACRDHN_18410, partial [Thermomicrobiales bacterium]
PRPTGAPDSSEGERENETDPGEHIPGSEPHPGTKTAPDQHPVLITPLTAESMYPLVDLIGELSRQNAELAAAAALWQERARHLETQLAALPAEISAAYRPWWKRLFGLE